MENALRYHSTIDLSEENSTHTQLVLLTGPDKKVLEVGPATGYITAALRERGCRVSCIENDPEAAKVAAQFCERMVVGDVEKIDFAAEFGDERFDVVMFGDVLEHLLDPQGVLARVAGILAGDGYVVASVPNITHGSIRLSLLRGDFRYTEIGLLDKTHLRFFTRDTLAELFQWAGYAIRTWRRTLIDPFITELSLREEEFPPYLVDSVRRDEESMTYQFIVTAQPSPAASNGRGTEADLARRIEGDALENLWQTDRDLRSTREERDAALAERDRLRAELAQVQSELRVRLDELEGALRRISDIERSVGWQALNRARPIIRRVAPRGSPQFRFLLGSARLGWRVLRLGARVLRLPGRALSRGRGSPSPAQPQAPGRPSVAPLRFGAYGEHCWSVGGGTVHALQVLIPLAPYYDVELLLPPGTPLRDRKWYIENLQIDIGDIKVRHYTPGCEQTYDFWLSVWNETIKAAPTPKRFNMVFFPFVSLDGAGYTHITNSDYSAGYLRERYGTDDVVVVPPHINVEEFQTGPKEPVILHCSRFALPSPYADKAHVMMIQAFKRLCERGLRGWKLVLAGATLDDFERTYVNHLARHAHGYPIEFAPNLSADELRKLFASASVYWHATGYSVKEPAAQEHFGITIVEGMASGAVPVSYNSGGPPSIIQHGENGFLFNTLDEMVDQTWEIIKDADRWDRMSRAARERARHYSPELVAGLVHETVGKTRKVSMIMGTHNNYGVLKRAIDSIMKHTPPGFELIVVNNASNDGTGSYLASLDYTHLKVLNNPVNESYAAFNNRGQALATRPYILYVNDDIEAFPGWLEPLIEMLDANPQVGAVGPRLLYPDGRVQCDGKMFAAKDLSPMHINMGGRPVEEETPIEVDALTAACVLVRGELAGFSEDYVRGYYEDTDLCLRIKEQGYALVLHRGSVLIHYHGMSMGRNQTATEEAQARNKEIFLERWRERIPELVYLASEEEMAGTEIRCRPVFEPGHLAEKWPISRRLIG